MRSNPTSEKTMGQQVLGFVICLAICFAAAGVGLLLTSTSVGGWYMVLVKPMWNPPNSVFGPVWSALYAMIAVAAWLVWRRGGDEMRLALAFFAIQLALNVAWSELFFWLRMPGVAFADILLLWLVSVLRPGPLVGSPRWQGCSSCLISPGSVLRRFST